MVRSLDASSPDDAARAPVTGMRSGPVDLAEEKINLSAVERVGVACERVGVVWWEAAEPGIDMTEEEVRVAVEVSSSSLREDLPTGVKALDSLFWRCRVRG